MEMQNIITHWIQETLGGQANGVTTVKDAISLLGENNFDMIVCDYHLPDGNGDEVLTFLRQKRFKLRPFCFLHILISHQILFHL